MTFTILPELAASFLLVFARVGALVMLMPALGDATIPARVRLSLALLLTLVVLPIVQPQLGADPARPEQLVALLALEVLTGLMLGVAIRVSVAAMQLAGTVAAQQMGLSYAAAFDPVSGAQNPTIATFLVLLASVLVMATELHHLAIRGIVESYRMVAPGVAPPPGDAAQLLLRALSAAFLIGVQISAPFLLFGIVFNLGLGVLSRLMPQLQIFFLALPATLLVGTLILIAAIGVMMTLYLAHLQSVITNLLFR